MFPKGIVEGFYPQVEFLKSLVRVVPFRQRPVDSPRKRKGGEEPTHEYRQGSVGT